MAPPAGLHKIPAQTASLLSLAVALYAIVNLFELIRIATTDWNVLNFAEHLAVEAASVAFVFLVGSGRLRLPWDRRNRLTHGAGGSSKSGSK